MRLFTVAKPFGLSLLLIITLFFCNAATPLPAEQQESDAAAGKPRKAINFTLKTLNGETFQLSAHKGKVVVLNFWATWCGPCRREVPDFVDMQKRLGKQGLLFVGISVDQEGEKGVRQFAEKYGINYPVMMDDGTVSRMYGPLRAVPTNVVIGRDGYIRYYIPGRLPKKRMEKLIMGLLSEQ